MAEFESLSFSSTGKAAAPAGNGAGRAGGTAYHRLAWLVLAVGLGALLADPLLRGPTTGATGSAGSPASAKAETTRTTAPADDFAVWQPPGLESLPSIAALSARAAGEEQELPPLPPRRPVPDQTGSEGADGANKAARPAPDAPRPPAAPAPRPDELAMAAPAAARTLPPGEVAVRPSLAAPVRPVLPVEPESRSAGHSGFAAHGQVDPRAGSASPAVSRPAPAGAGRVQAGWTPPLPPRRPSVASAQAGAATSLAAPAEAASTPRRPRRLDLTLDWSRAAAAPEAGRWLAALAPAAAESDLELPPRLREALLREDARAAEALAQGVLEVVTGLDDPVLRLIREPQRLVRERRAGEVEAAALDLVERSFTAAGDLERVLQRADRRFGETLMALDLGTEGAAPRQLRARQAQRQQAGLALGQEILSRQADYLMAVADLAGALQAMDPELASGPGGLRYADEGRRAQVTALAEEVDRAHAALNRLAPALRGLAEDYTAALGLPPQADAVRVAQTRDGGAGARGAN